MDPFKLFELKAGKERVLDPTEAQEIFGEELFGFLKEHKLTLFALICENEIPGLASTQMVQVGIIGLDMDMPPIPDRIDQLLDEGMVRMEQIYGTKPEDDLPPFALVDSMADLALDAAAELLRFERTGGSDERLLHCRSFIEFLDEAPRDYPERFDKVCDRLKGYACDLRDIQHLLKRAVERKATNTARTTLQPLERLLSALHAVREDAGREAKKICLEAIQQMKKTHAENAEHVKQVLAI